MEGRKRTKTWEVEDKAEREDWQEGEEVGRGWSLGRGGAQPQPKEAAGSSDHSSPGRVSKSATASSYMKVFSFAWPERQRRIPARGPAQDSILGFLLLEGLVEAFD